MSLDLPSCAVVGAAGADVVTTELALADGGFRELNPVLQNRGVRIGGKVLVTAAILGAGAELKKHGHRGVARVVLWTAAGVWAGAAVWNYRQLRGH